MDTPRQSMPEMPSVPEKLEGLQVVPYDELDAGMEHQILSLQYSALDTDKNKNLEMRKESVKESKLHHEHLKGSAHGDVLVAVHGDKVVGVLTLNREKGIGKIDDIWLYDANNQDVVIAQLLERAKFEMRNGAVRCERAVIEAPHPSREMRRVYHEIFGSDSRTFYSFETKDT